MLQKFIFWTGALDFLVGLGAWAGAVANQAPGQFVSLITLGTFLMMAAACLMWASQDIGNRYPVIFWQGLVRFSAAAAVVYAVPRGIAEPWEYSLVAFDGTISLVYIFGSIRVSGLSFFSCLMCRKATPIIQ